MGRSDEPRLRRLGPLVVVLAIVWGLSGCWSGGREDKDEDECVWGLIRAAQSSVAELCVIPLQDYLCLGNEARMNTPSTLGDNWKWRLRRGQLTDEVIGQIKAMTRLYGRTQEYKKK